MSGVTKAVLLARGAGTRMRQHGTARLRPDQVAAADRGAKAMMPLGGDGGGDGSGAGRPLLDYTLSTLADAGYRDVCLVIAPDHAATRAYYRDLAPAQRVRVHFAEQVEPRGTADAVAAAAAFIGEDHVLVLNGDNYYPLAALSALRQLDEAGTMLFRAPALVALGNIPPERVRAFAIGAVDARGYLTRLIEKPTDDELAAAGPEALVSMNCWLLPPPIVEACRSIAPSSRGELELTQAIAYAIDKLGIRIRVLISDEGVLDLSRRDDVATIAARLDGLRPRP